MSRNLRIDLPTDLDPTSPEFIAALNDRLRRLGEATRAIDTTIEVLGRKVADAAGPTSGTLTSVTISAVEVRFGDSDDDGNRPALLVVTFRYGAGPANGVHAWVEAPKFSGQQNTKLDSLFKLDSAQLTPNEQRRDLGGYDNDPLLQNTDGSYTITLNAIPSPLWDQTWRVWLEAYDRDGAALDTSRAGSFDVAVTPAPNYGHGSEYAPLVSNVAAAVEKRWNGRWEWRATITWTDPDLASAVNRFGSFGSVRVFFFHADGSQNRFDPVSPGTQIYVSDWTPMPNAADLIRADVYSMDKQNRRNGSVPGVTPSVTFTVDAAPIVGDVTGFNVIAGYGYNEHTGAPALILDPVFTAPVLDGAPDPSFINIQLWVHIRDTGGWVRVGDPGQSHERIEIDEQYFPPAAQTWDCYAIPVDRAGNTKYDMTLPNPQPGAAPMVTVNVPAPTGGSGIEYCSNPDALSATVIYDVSADGIETYGFRVTVTDTVARTDPRYKGPAIIVFDDQNRKQILGYPPAGAASFDFAPVWPIVRPGAIFTMYAAGYDGARVNTIVDLVTPKVTGLTIGLQTTGKLKASRIDTTTLPSILDSTQMQVVAGKIGVKLPEIATALGFNDGTVFTLVSGQVHIAGVDLGKAITSTVGTMLDATTGVLKVKASGITADLVSSYAINNTHLQRVGVDKIAIIDADIVNLAANKLTAGTLAAGVIYAGTIAATQIAAGTLAAGVIYSGTINASQVNTGTLNAVNLVGGTLTLNSNNVTTTIANSYDSFNIAYAGLKTVDNVSGVYSLITYNRAFFCNSSSVSTAQIGTAGSGASFSGFVVLYNYNQTNSVSIQTSVPKVYISDATQSAEIGPGYLKLNGNQVVAPRQTGPGNTTDATDVAIRFNNLLTALRNHGLIT